MGSCLLKSDCHLEGENIPLIFGHPGCILIVIFKLPVEVLRRKGGILEQFPTDHTPKLVLWEEAEQVIGPFIFGT